VVQALRFGSAVFAFYRLIAGAGRALADTCKRGRIRIPVEGRLDAGLRQQGAEAMGLPKEGIQRRFGPLARPVSATQEGSSRGASSYQGTERTAEED